MVAILFNGLAWSGSGHISTIINTIGIRHHFNHFLNNYMQDHWPNWQTNFANEILRKQAIGISSFRDPRDMMVIGGLRMDLTPHPRISASRLREKIQLDIFIDFLRNGPNRGWVSFNNYAQDMRDFWNFHGDYKLKFEQLAFQPIETLKKLIDFLQYPPVDDEIIKNALKQHPRTGKIGLWIHHFNDEIEATFKELGGDIVSYLGYEPDENWSYKEYLHKTDWTEEEYWNFKPRKL